MLEDLDLLDDLLAQTVYRVVQEGVTNVFRHANASTMDVAARHEGDNLLIEIADDVRRTPDMKFGRGLTGLSERVRALDGKLQFAREDERTIVHRSLPIRHEADVRRT
jgi:signal transduction histidine kinase